MWGEPPSPSGNRVTVHGNGRYLTKGLAQLSCHFDIPVVCSDPVAPDRTPGTASDNRLADYFTGCRQEEMPGGLAVVIWSCGSKPAVTCNNLNYRGLPAFPVVSTSRVGADLVVCSPSPPKRWHNPPPKIKRRCNPKVLRLSSSIQSGAPASFGYHQSANNLALRPSFRTQRVL